MRPTSSSFERRLAALALLFGWFGAASLSLQTRDTLPLVALACLSAVVVALHVWLNRFAPSRDGLILPLVTLLLCCGTLVIARVAPNFTLRQVSSLAFATLAFAAITASRDKLRWLKRFKYTWLLAAFVLLVATLWLGVNPSGGGARLWLSIGGLFLQPSETLRLMMIAFWAAFLSERMLRRDQRATSLRSMLTELLPAIVMWLAAVGLLATQQDLGAASLLLLTFAFMLYLATGRKRVPLALIVAFFTAGVAGSTLSPRVATRISIWLNPDIDPQGRSFQIVQSMIAIANGGVLGQGLYQGRPDYVPAVHTDFPFVVIAEEFGLIGALALLAAFALLCERAWRVALRSNSLYVRLLSGGIAASLVIQVAVIVGGNLALFPLTGVTLPFVSYGGSSLLAWMVAAGLLIRLSSDAESAQSQAAGATAPDLPVQRNAARLLAGLMGVLALATASLMLLRAQALVARTDNPRRVEDERAIARGPILARDGMPLVLSAPVADINGRAMYSRTYLLPAAVGAVGYYSQRYGAGGIEAFADATLRGTVGFGDALLHRRQTGAPLTITLDAALQTALSNALVGEKGAAIVLDWRSGEVLALSSTPGFDPNFLDRDWDALRANRDAPLVNRVTQGLYQPGALLAWLYDTPPGSFTWDPSDRFGLSRNLSFELSNEVVPYPATGAYSETIGQGALRVTPLRIAISAAGIARGQAVTPTLILPAAQVATVSTQTARRTGVFETVAQMGPNQTVAWHVRITDQYVIVIAIEQREPTLTRLHGIAMRVP